LDTILNSFHFAWAHYCARTDSVKKLKTYLMKQMKLAPRVELCPPGLNFVPQPGMFLSSDVLKIRTDPNLVNFN
jgi:hypothetical protein